MVEQLVAKGWFIQAAPGAIRCIHPKLPKVMVTVAQDTALVSYGSNTGCKFTRDKSWFVQASVDQVKDAVVKHATGEE